MAISIAPNHDTHIRKRPYQPSITSYFSLHNSNTTRSYRATSPLSPPLPAETQASLLSVGMRVRKSVPEGYKTHKTLGSAGFPFPSSAPARTETRYRHCDGSSTSTRELTPFCGLHKTGSWAAQEMPSSSAPAVMAAGYDEDRMELPELVWSQSSFASTAQRSEQCTNRKRTYEEEVEDEFDAYFHAIEQNGPSMEQQGMYADRPIARMKRAPAKARSEGIVKVFGEDDFEDAAFLVPMDVDGV